MKKLTRDESARTVAESRAVLNEQLHDAIARWRLLFDAHEEVLRCLGDSARVRIALSNREIDWLVVHHALVAEGFAASEDRLSSVYLARVERISKAIEKAR